MAHDPNPPSCPSDARSIQRIIRKSLSISITIHQVLPLSNHLHRISTIHLSNNTRLILKLPPSTSTHVLRHERYSLASEAAILTLLSKRNLPTPKSLRYEPRSDLLGCPFLLTTHLPGVPYSEAFPRLTHSEQQDVELQLRALISRVSKYTALRFGPAAKVAAGSGLPTWQKAFAWMMENVLMDGEDVTVNLPYVAIREAIRVRGACLDGVKEARLVVVGLGKRKNVRIDRKTNDVVGLMDFGGAVWGDVAFGDDELGVKCAEGGRVLLYTCYHAVVTIVTNHYRPQKDASRELEARKSLTTALKRLESASVKREP